MDHATQSGNEGASCGSANVGIYDVRAGLAGCGLGHPTRGMEAGPLAGGARALDGASLRDDSRFWARRDLDLSNLLWVFPETLADKSGAGIDHMIALLTSTLNGEIERGRSGHWAYDHARPQQLKRCLEREIAIRANGCRPVLAS